MYFYAKNNKIFSLWTTFAKDRYIVRFFVLGGMYDWSLKNDDSFLDNLESKVSSDEMCITYCDKEIFDIIKLLIDNNDETLTDISNKYPNSKASIKVGNYKKTITLRLRITGTNSFDLTDSFYPMKLISFIRKLM